MWLGGDGHISDTNVGVGSTGVGDAVEVGEIVGVCAGAEVGGGDSFEGMAVGERAGIVVVRFG
jgi:hypothetical protein